MVPKELPWKPDNIGLGNQKCKKSSKIFTAKQTDKKIGSGISLSVPFLTKVVTVWYVWSILIWNLVARLYTSNAIQWFNKQYKFLPMNTKRHHTSSKPPTTKDTENIVVLFVVMVLFSNVTVCTTLFGARQFHYYFVVGRALTYKRH